MLLGAAPVSLPDFQTGFLTEPDGAVRPYVAIGSGPMPMVVIPGVADGLRTCVDVAVYLAWFYRERARSCRLLILSRREPIPEGFGVARHAQDMIRTVEELNFFPAVWECLSAAGPIGQWAAVDRPDLVSGLILTSSYDHVTAPTREVLQQWLNIAEQAGSDRFWEMFEPKVRPPADVLAQVDPAQLPGRPQARDPTRLKRILTELLDLDHRTLVPRIACPTLVIGGEDDRVVPPDVQRAMAGRIANHVLEICPGYGHLNDMENPAYQQSVDRFLCAVTGSANGRVGC
jgi:pimeloyl-ACP methyl ester carboxylesterase